MQKSGLIHNINASPQGVYCPADTFGRRKISWNLSDRFALIFERLKVLPLMGEARALEQEIRVRGIISSQLFGKALYVEHDGVVTTEEVYQVGWRKQIAAVGL